MNAISAIQAAGERFIPFEEGKHEASRHDQTAHRVTIGKGSDTRLVGWVPKDVTHVQSVE